MADDTSIEFVPEDLASGDRKSQELDLSDLEVPGDETDDLPAVTFHLLQGRYGDFIHSPS